VCRYTLMQGCEPRTVDSMHSERCLHLSIGHFRESRQTILPEAPTAPEPVLRCSPERRSAPLAQSHRRNSDADPLVRRVPLARTRVCREVFALRSQIETLRRETSLSKYLDRDHYESTHDECDIYCLASREASTQDRRKRELSFSRR